MVAIARSNRFQHIAQFCRKKKSCPVWDHVTGNVRRYCCSAVTRSRAIERQQRKQKPAAMAKGPPAWSAGRRASPDGSENQPGKRGCNGITQGRDGKNVDPESVKLPLFPCMLQGHFPTSCFVYKESNNNCCHKKDRADQYCISETEEILENTQA